MAELDREKAGRKVWVVRVPPHVAKQWREVIAAQANQEVDEDNDETATLGHLRLEEGNPTTLTVRGADGGQELLYMNPNRDTVDTTILSYEPAADGSLTHPRVDGVVFKRFDAGPVRLTDVGRTGAGLTEEQRRPVPGGQVDAAYFQSSRKRLAASIKPQQKRKIALIEDDSEVTKLAGGTNEAPLYVKNRQLKHKAAVAGTANKKREKLSKDELEEQLFNLFAQQQHWHFTQLQKTLDQPIASVKEVLIQIADQVKRGPNKDLWELKPHYKNSTQPAAAAAAGGG